MSFPFSHFVPLQWLAIAGLCLLCCCPQFTYCQEATAPGSPYRDSLTAIIKTLDKEADKFFQYTRIFAQLDYRDTALTQAYLDTLSGFSDKIPANYFAGHFYYHRGKMYKQQQKFTEALQDVELAIPAYAAEDNVKMEARTNHLASGVLSATQQYDEAFNYASRAATLYRAAGGEENDLAGALTTMGTSQQRAGNFEPALAYFREAAAIYRRLKNQQNLFHPLLNLGITHGRMKEPDSAIFYYQQALQEAAHQGSRKDFLSAYVNNNLSATYKLQGNMEAALSSGRGGLPHLQIDGTRPGNGRRSR